MSAVGRRLGRYELLHRLGQGGGGEVWEALLHGPAGFRRRVAVKLLPPGAGASAADDLVQEARLGALVAHPNVVSTLELGQHDGQWFLVMDLVRGCSVQQLRRQSAFSPAALLDIGVQVCDGLTHIHTLADHEGWPVGLVHRDIKPGNLMIDATHRVRIVDLGIARLQGTSEVPSGTPGYVAPEQLEGHEGPRADLFALGVTLTRLAVGRWPFGKGAEGLMQVSGPDADRLATAPALRGALDAFLPGLGAVLSRAMRADPAARWSDAAELRAALVALYAGCPDAPRLTSMAVATGASSGEETTGQSTERGAFVGRSSEQDALAGQLDADAAWVVVVGPGGVGKTRLVDEVLRGRTCTRVDVAKARSPSGLYLAVADALGVTVGPDPVASVGAALGQVGLLVLDEVEQVVEAAAEAIVAWRAQAPSLSVLCTSRVAPAHADATLVRLGPLPLDDARRLFSLRLGGTASPEVVDPLLRALDRLPLAVELAAARARRTSPARVLAQLRAASSARVPGLREALEASWELLPADLQDALVRLSAYEGSFDAQDAVAVLDTEGASLGQLEALVGHSLLHVRGNRFRLLTSVKAFAREHRAEARRVGEQRHGRWLSRLGEAQMILLAVQHWSVTLKMATNLDDLIVASRRAVTRGDAEVAAATALAAVQALTRVGSPSLAMPLVEAALPLGAREAELRRARGVILYRSGREGDALRTFEEALEVVTGRDRLPFELMVARMRFQGRADELRRVELAIQALIDAGMGHRTEVAQESLGQMYAAVGRLTDGERLLNQTQARRERLGRDTANLRGLLADVHARRGQFRRAIQAMEAAHEELASRRADLLQAVWMGKLADVLRAFGDTEGAESWATRCIPLGLEVGYTPVAVLGRHVLLQLALDRGDRAAAEAHTAEAYAVLGSTDDGGALARVDVARARVAFWAGDAERGNALLARAQVRKHWHLYVALEVVEVAVELGDPVEARAWLEESETKVTVEDRVLRLRLLVARAVLEHRTGHRNEARGALLQASQLLGETDLPPEAPLARRCAALRAQLAG